MGGVSEDKLLVSTYAASSVSSSIDSKSLAGGTLGGTINSKLTERQRKEGRFVTRKTESAFSDVLSKIKRLFPYVWPKGTHLR